MHKTSTKRKDFLHYFAYNIFIQHWLYEEVTPPNEIKSIIRHLRSEYGKDVIKDKQKLVYRCKTKQKRINNISKTVISRLTTHKVDYQYPENYLFMVGGFINTTYYNELFYSHHDKVMQQQFQKKMTIIHFDLPRILTYKAYLSKMRFIYCNH
jgi:hypothetical protein